MRKTLITFIYICGFFASAFGQGNSVSGVVTDAQTGEPVPGTSVVIKGSSDGTITNYDGKYSINADEKSTLVFSFVGYTLTEVVVGSQTVINVKLDPSTTELEEMVIVGTRSIPRSTVDTPVPVDKVSAKELTATGQPTFDKALQYKIPSFNTVQTPVNDATSLLDPYEIRNMGPSRTLILVNGKRKNLSSLLYTQTSPGRGETGADISAIPTDAIKQVQILRDGASAQYGSDAIAGVMNIIMKDDAEGTSATLRTGITSEGDGEMIGLSINGGAALGKEKGFINYTADFSQVGLANRPGTVDADGELQDFLDGDESRRAEVENFLAQYPDAGNVNGSPETTASKFALNSGYDLNESTELYMNAAYVYKKVNSFANYRTPYWRTLDEFPYLAAFYPNGPDGQYVGYLPTFEGNLSDYNGTIGIKSKINDWNTDVSFTTGGNMQTYRVNNSHNGNSVLSPPTADITATDTSFVAGVELYRENSKVSFDPGGTKFTHNVGNIDISKQVTDKLALAFGSEFRIENFEIIEGELASYDGGGADSFAGNTPENSGKFDRYNFGGYADVLYDITEDFLINGTVRLENYSDFGEAFVWKASSRYKLFDEGLILRGSYSTGFRAPTLHQIYTQRAQYSFVPGQGIQVGGLINNVSREARLLGVPKLDAEESTNFTFGFGSRLGDLNITVDYYNIEVRDRIILSTELTPPTGSAFEGLSDVSFFVNALDTRTSGLDVVISYSDLEVGPGTFNFNLSGNYTLQNERIGSVKNPAFAELTGQSVANATQEALFFTSRPVTKWILGINYELDKIGFALNNTYFGKTEFRQDGLNENLKTEFDPKVVTDLAVTYHPIEKLTLAFNVNNIFNVLPEWKFVALNDAGKAILADPDQVKENSNLITFNQRYSQMTYDGYHFSQLGTMFSLSANYRF
ncbi:TonB-dependent receptor [Reichenbachiella versicolor]|uniref:TonB-dependent receptor n=1 Tax=Reichenbachiella versicolor TaxID=1821036 RepID=UPI000D6DEA2A|nr:TonB-dependent receptor [Reichenbachiella versicolor]